MPTAFAAICCSHEKVFEVAGNEPVTSRSWAHPADHKTLNTKKPLCQGCFCASSSSISSTFQRSQVFITFKNSSMSLNTFNATILIFSDASLKPQLSEPDFAIAGGPSIKQYHVLNDKRHILVSGRLFDLCHVCLVWLFYCFCSHYHWLWHNGLTVVLLIRRLWVRIPQGAGLLFFFSPSRVSFITT